MVLRLTRALALLFIAACSVVTVTWASVALPVELDGLTLEQQVALLSSTLDTCHKFAQQTLQENKSLKETVRRAEDALTLLQRDNEELRSKNAWHIVGLHGSRLHRTWQGTGAFLRRVARIFLGDRIDAISGAYSAFRARLSRDLGAAGQTFVRNYQWLRGHVKRLFLWLGWKRLSGDAYVEFFTATGVGFVALISFSYSLLRFLDKIMTRNAPSRDELVSQLRAAIDPQGEMYANPDLQAAARGSAPVLSPHYDNRSHPTGERTDQPECSALEVLLKCTQALTAGCTLSEGGQSRGRGQRRFRSSSGGGSAACKAEGAQRESGAESGAESAVGEGATETEQGAGGRGEVDKKSGGKRIAGKEAVGGTRSSDVR